jgi:hypothetical protein
VSDPTPSRAECEGSRTLDGRLTTSRMGYLLTVAASRKGERSTRRMDGEQQAEQEFFARVDSWLGQAAIYLYVVKQLTQILLPKCC